MESTEEENNQYLFQVIYGFANVESYQFFTYANIMTFLKNVISKLLASSACSVVQYS